MSNYLYLFFTFFRVGLFTIGGGLAAIPLLENYAITYGWVDEKMFADMIAISESTPGPIGVNMATYVGLSQLGFGGSIVATAGIVMPSLLIIYGIAKFLKGVNEHWIVQGVLKGVRPTVIGIIGSTLLSIGRVSVLNTSTDVTWNSWFERIDFKSSILFCIFTIVVMKVKIHPIFFIIAAGAIGIILF